MWEMLKLIIPFILGLFIGLYVAGKALNRVAEVTCGEGVESTYENASIYCMANNGTFEQVVY